MKTSIGALRKWAVVGLALTFGALAFAELPPDNVQGNWTIYSTNIDDGATVIKHVQIAQYGDQITGFFEGPVQSGPIRGVVKGHHVEFATVTRNVLTFRGRIDGDTMSGLYGIHGRKAPWQAARPATTAAVIYPSQPVIVPAAQPVYQYAAPAVAAVPAPQPAAQPAPAPAPAPVPLSADQLDSIVAPIALYPDALLAQVLAATTKPDEIAYADDWVAQNKILTGSALTQAVDQQSWDPSIKALTQFPSVLDNLAHNVSWTTSLGDAFTDQQPDVMAAVQRMRAKAHTTGTLQSNSQVTVIQAAPNTIVIQPANPQTVYVPVYNPAVVYGAPVVVPFYVPPPMPVAHVGIFFGTGVAVGAWGGGANWGWHAWNMNWGCCGGGGSTTIIFNHTTYINNRIPGPGGRGYVGPNGYYHPDPGYHPGTDTSYGPHGAYHPNGYFGPNGGWHPDVPGTNPKDLPNGGNNGNHGLIGGNSAVQKPATEATQHAPAGAPAVGASQAHSAGGQLLSQNRGSEHAPSGFEPNQSHSGREGSDGSKHAAHEAHPVHEARERPVHTPRAHEKAPHMSGEEGHDRR